MKPQSVTFKLKQSDYMAAIRLGSRRIWLILFTGAFFVVVSQITSHKSLASSLSDPWIMLCLVSLGSGFIWIPLAARRNYRRQASLRDEFRVWWDEYALNVTTDNSHSSTRWGDFLGRRESAKSILLYWAPNIFFVLPKRVLSVDQRDALSPLLSRIPKHRGIV